MMFDPIIYIDHSEVREGKLAELKTAINELAKFVEANEPRLIAYRAYSSEDGTRMSVVHIHADAASLAFHMQVAGPAFPKFAEYVKLLTIDLYGRPGDDLVEQMRQKARMLGADTVRVHELHAGFARLGTR
jgi:quinol monooxygenase YgiN